MLIAERRRRILEHVDRRGYASFRDLADLIGSSESTVRRDLRALAADGRLTATRGGAGRRDDDGERPGRAEPSAGPAASAPSAPSAGPVRPDPAPGLAGPVTDDLVATARAAIAERAAQLVEPGSAVLLGPGRSTLALAHRLAGMGPLTVVTNSAPVTAALMDAEQVDLVMLGGTLRRSINAFVGPLTEQSLQGLRGSLVFLSGEGLTVERGLTTPNVFAAAIDMAMVAAAQRVVVLVDHTKIGRDTMCQTVPTARIDLLVTDRQADQEALQSLVAAGVEVLIADDI